MNGFCYHKLNWKLNPCYDKWLGFTNFYIFDDRFNWCPFWFNIVIMIFIFFVSVPILKFWIHIIVFSQYVVDVLKMPLIPFTRPVDVA